MATITEKLGSRIRQLRRKQNLSQEELAIKAKIDLTSVNEIESGNRNPSVRTVHKIAIALDTSLKEIFSF
jgi:transcriptional regulator with XRE-family HTH domain